MRISLVPVAVLLHATLCPLLLQAQADTAAPARGGVCFRARPMPTCRGFWITEFGLSMTLGNSASERAPWYATWDLGGMVNTGRRSAFGATLFFGGDDDGYRWGIKPRYRRWLSGTTSLELAAGVLLAGTDSVLLRSDPIINDYVRQHFPSFTSSLSLNVEDWLGVGFQLEAVRGARLTSTYDPGTGMTTTQTFDVTDVTGYAGVQLGSYAGAVASVVLPIIIIAAISRDQSY